MLHSLLEVISSAFTYYNYLHGSENAESYERRKQESNYADYNV